MRLSLRARLHRIAWLSGTRTLYPGEKYMGRIAAKITGVAGYVPPRVLTNADLEKMVDTSDAWIRERTGISERHVVDPGVATSHLATAAAERLLEQTGTRPEDLDLIIVATVTP